MNAILAEDFESLGYSGELVPVRRGFFRHFLQPTGIAIYATKENMQAHNIAVPKKEKGAKKEASARQEASDVFSEAYGRRSFQHLKDRTGRLRLIFARKPSEKVEKMASRPLTAAEICTKLMKVEELPFLTPDKIAFPNANQQLEQFYDGPITVNLTNPITKQDEEVAVEIRFRPFMKKFHQWDPTQEINFSARKKKAEEKAAQAQQHKAAAKAPKKKAGGDKDKDKKKK